MHHNLRLATLIQVHYRQGEREILPSTHVRIERHRMAPVVWPIIFSVSLSHMDIFSVLELLTSGSTQFVPVSVSFNFFFNSMV